jgi:hypothetical protein
MNCRLIDWAQFETGFECYNFVLADADGVIHVDASEQLIQDFKEAIQGRMLQGYTFMDVARDGVVIEVRGVRRTLLEIQWG